MSLKNSNDTIGNRTRDLPTCSAVPQPTAPTRAPIAKVAQSKNFLFGLNTKIDLKNIKTASDNTGKFVS